MTAPSATRVVEWRPRVAPGARSREVSQPRPSNREPGWQHRPWRTVPHRIRHRCYRDSCRLRPPAVTTKRSGSRVQHRNSVRTRCRRAPQRRERERRRARHARCAALHSSDLPCWTQRIHSNCERSCAALTSAVRVDANSALATPEARTHDVTHDRSWLTEPTGECPDRRCTPHVVAAHRHPGSYLRDDRLRERRCCYVDWAQEVKFSVAGAHFRRRHRNRFLGGPRLFDCTRVPRPR